MDAAVFIGRLLLAAVFLLAGIAKLADRAGARQAVVDFGVPASLAAPVGLFLPLVEIAVAAGLLWAGGSRVASGAAIALLSLFSAGIAANVARGRKPDCHCFGQVHSAPVGWSTLARNGLFAVIAALVLWRGPGDAGDAVGWVGDLRTGEAVGLAAILLLLALAAVEGWFISSLMRQNGQMLVRLEAVEAALGPALSPASAPLGLAVGTPAPAFTLSELSGDPMALELLLAPGKPVMLVFTDPECGPCTALLPDVGRWQREHADRVTITLVASGGRRANRAHAAEHGLEHVLVQEDEEVSQAYKSPGSPSAVVVAPDGRIGSPVAAGAEAIHALVADLVQSDQPLSVVQIEERSGDGLTSEDARDRPGGPAAETR